MKMIFHAFSYENDQVRGGDCEGIDLHPQLEHHPPRPEASERDAYRPK